MLPDAYFDRLTRALGVRTDGRHSERRRAIRVPASLRPDIYAVSSGVLLPPQRARARDISANGIGLLVPKQAVILHAAVIALRPSGTDGEQFVIACILKRATKLDGNWVLMGMGFERLLRPGQAIDEGTGIAELLWIDVSGDTAP